MKRVSFRTYGNIEWHGKNNLIGNTSFLGEHYEEHQSPLLQLLPASLEEYCPVVLPEEMKNIEADDTIIHRIVKRHLQYRPMVVPDFRRALTRKVQSRIRDLYAGDLKPGPDSSSIAAIARARYKDLTYSCFLKSSIACAAFRPGVRPHCCPVLLDPFRQVHHAGL